MTETINRYLNCWNETDATVRTALLADVFAQEVTYVDPLVDITGRAAMDATIAAVQAQFPGCTFTLLDAVDAHHAQVRFRWGLGPVAGEPIIEGFDVATFDDQGRITGVLGFLDKVPAAV